MVILFLNCSIPDLVKPCINILGIERYTLKDSTSLENSFIKVGIRNAPIIVAIVIINSIHLKIYKSPLFPPVLILFSIVLANRGACRVLAVLEIRANILNTAKATAILPVFIPTILTE